MVLMMALAMLIGWSHHLVSQRRYHIIIPADDEWNKPLSPNAFHLATHLLHGLLHCNGFGHLVLINGHEGGSSHISGRTLMDLWDRFCTSLRVREVTVEDVSRKYSVDLRLLLGIAYGAPWFARWGYCFRPGSFGLTKHSYTDALDLLSFLPLDSLLADDDSNSCINLQRIVTSYRNRHLHLATVRDLFCCLIDLIKHKSNTNGTPAATSMPVPPPPPPPLKAAKKARSVRKRKSKYPTFKLVADHLGSRWPVRRLIMVAQVVLDALVEHGRMMTRQEVRDAARVTIGDTGLIDFVLKSLGDTVIDGYVIRRKSNPATRVLEFSLDRLPPASNCEVTTTADQATRIPNSTTPPSGPTENPNPREDLRAAYKSILEMRPGETRLVLDAKHWAKIFDLRDELDDLLRFFVHWMPSVAQMDGLTRRLPPPELVVLDTHATVGDLGAEAERAMRDTYCVMERFRASVVEGIEGEYWEPVMLGGIQSGAGVWVRGEGVELCELKYEGGEDTWAVECGCGATEDDGERMVACEACDVWHHTRCIGIEDDEPLPQLFVCGKCGSSILSTVAAEEEMRFVQRMNNAVADEKPARLGRMMMMGIDVA